MVRSGFYTLSFAVLALAGCAGPNAGYAPPDRQQGRSPQRRCSENLILVRADRPDTQPGHGKLADTSSHLPETVADQARRFTVAIRTIRTGTDAQLTAGK